MKLAAVLFVLAILFGAAVAAEAPEGMVLVPGGTFPMGGDPDDKTCEPDEFPPHTVTLSPYCMDRNEVTNAQYERCVRAGACRPSRYAGSAKWGRSEQPVVGVSWNDANAYCEWAGKRLPTEAEWEYAARGAPSGTADGMERGDPDASRFKVKSRRIGALKSGPNELGLLNMCGSVWEWCADFFDEAYYSRSPRENPRNDDPARGRVVRGSCHFIDGRPCRETARYRLAPTLRRFFVGFRCVQESPSSIPTSESPADARNM